MKKFLTTVAAVSAVGVAAVSLSTTAEARWYGPGPFVAGAVIGGAVAAAAARPYYYPHGYYPYGPYAYYGRACQRAWNGYAWVRVCY